MKMTLSRSSIHEPSASAAIVACGTEGLSAKTKSSRRLMAGKRASIRRGLRALGALGHLGFQQRPEVGDRRLLLARGLGGQCAETPADGRELELDRVRLDQRLQRRGLRVRWRPSGSSEQLVVVGQVGTPAGRARPGAAVVGQRRRVPSASSQRDARGSRRRGRRARPPRACHGRRARPGRVRARGRASARRPSAAQPPSARSGRSASSTARRTRPARHRARAVGPRPASARGRRACAQAARGSDRAGAGAEPAAAAHGGRPPGRRG